jgi:endogenous inhibitor of DNA gyrase (YacG/DUF329 family)
MAPIVDCPVCGRRTEFAPANRWRPFCSQRCKLIDLGEWATGGYAIPGDAPDPEAPGELPGETPARTDRPPRR